MKNVVGVANRALCFGLTGGFVLLSLSDKNTSVVILDKIFGWLGPPDMVGLVPSQYALEHPLISIPLFLIALCATKYIHFESTESELDEQEKQNDLLKDQLLEASLKHDVELCVLLNHECVDKILSDELDQVKKKSFEIQEGLQSRIKILEKDVQRCQKQSVDFELKLQHEKEKHKWDSTSRNKNTNPLDYSWISKLEKLENENVSLDFKVQSLIKERDNVKIEYQKLFDSIKKTRSQTQKEMDELIVHVSEKTYAYGAIRAENQDLLSTIIELKTRLEKVEKGKSINTKFYKTNGSQSLLCVTRLNKHAFQKKTNVSKTEENHVVSKPVTLQTSSTKQIKTNQNKNVIKPGMYRVVTTQESQTNKTKSALSSTGMNATSRVRRPMSRDSHVAHSVLDNSKKAAKNVSVYVRKNKQKDNTSANVISNKENVIDVDVANASKAKTLLCVSCMQNVLIPCHDKCLAKHKLNVRSNVRRTFSTNSRTPKSLETTYVAPKTRFSKKETQSKTLDTTSVVSKSKIDVESASKAKDKVSSASRIKKTNLRDKPLSTFIKNKIRTSRIWQKWFESQPNVIWTPVNIKPNVANTRSSEKPSVSIKKWVVKLPIIIMAQQQHAADVHPDELCPPNKRYDLMDANKKVDLEHVQCPPESKILTNIIKNHPLRFSIAASSSVPWIYMAQKTQRQSWNADTSLDDHRRNEAHGALSDVCRVNVTDEDEEITDEVYELKRREKRKNVEETRNSPIPTPIRSPRIHTNLVSSDTEKLQELTDTPHTTSSSSSPHKKLTKMNRLLSLFKTKPTRFKRYKSFFHELQGRYGYLFAHLRARFMPRKSFNTLVDNLHDVMVETLPTIVDKHVKKQVMKQVPEQVRYQVLVTPAVHPRDQDDPHDDAHPKGENSAKRQKTSEYEAYVSGESSSRQVFQGEQAPSTSGNQEQDDDFDFWTDSYASDDDEIPTKQVSQDIIEEVSLTINEAKLRKMADEMLRQRCTSGNEHQYHID
ncbi:hypothetical protein Tco_0351938 [Tanacetum coccineum]